MKFKTLMLSATSAAAVTLAGVAAHAEDYEVVILQSLTGGAAFIGKNVADGAVLAAIQRVLRILPEDTPVDRSEPESAAEQALVREVERLEQAMAGHEGDVERLFAAAGDLPAVVETYFEQVRVMDPDPAVKAARLGLLARLAAVAVPEIAWTEL